VTHSSAGRSRDTGDEGNDRLGDLASLVELLEELGGVFLHGATDLADEDDTLGAGVVEKDLKGVDVGGSEARDKESIENKVSIKDENSMENGARALTRGKGLLRFQ
jgi:hypothetical protein